MKKLLAPLIGLLALSAGSWAAPNDFQITKVIPSVIRTPDYTYNGDQRRTAGQPGQWLEVEVQFDAVPDYTDEMTFKYYIDFNNTLLTGEVVHVNIPKGRDLRSVMYVAPRTLTRLLNGKTLTAVSIKRITVQVLSKGQFISEGNYKSPPSSQWWQALQQTTGLVLNKNQTPFAPLYWDRYEAIKESQR